METRKILEQLKNGMITIEEAERHLKKQPFEEMGYPFRVSRGGILQWKTG